MLNKIKEYILWIAGLVITVLIGILKFKDTKIEKISTENAGLRNEKALGDVSNEAKNSRVDFDNDKSDYDKWKLGSGKKE